MEGQQRHPSCLTGSYWTWKPNPSFLTLLPTLADESVLLLQAGQGPQDSLTVLGLRAGLPKQQSLVALNYRLLPCPELDS